MLSWFAENLSTILVLVVLVTVVASDHRAYGEKQEEGKALLRLRLSELPHERQLPSE